MPGNMKSVKLNNSAYPERPPHPSSHHDKAVFNDLMIEEISVRPEPRMSADELSEGFAEITGRVAEEEERLRKLKEAEEERRRKKREEEERRRKELQEELEQRHQHDGSGNHNPQTRQCDSGDIRNIRFSIASVGTTRYSTTTADFESISAMVQPRKTFGMMLMRYVNERCGGKAPECYRRAGVSKQLYSIIISDPNKSVKKRTALQLCIGLKLNRQQAAEFISYAGYSFSPSSFEDQTFAWCLEHCKYSIFDVNELLARADIEPVAIN